jgi:hypothetical protein
MDADLVAWEVAPAVERGVGEAFRHARALLAVIGGRVVLHP